MTVSCHVHCVTYNLIFTLLYSLNIYFNLSYVYLADTYACI